MSARSRNESSGHHRQSRSRIRRLISAAVLAVALLALAAPSAKALTTPELLDELQRGAFDYFWLEANPANGMIKDRSTASSPCSVASVGFGLSAICIGIDHGWISREEGRTRVLTTLQTFWNGAQGDSAGGIIGYKGFFYHFLDMITATRAWSSELSTIDTALFLAGMLDAKQYFDGVHPDEVLIRDLATNINDRVDWNWSRGGGVGIRLGWKPVSEFSGFGIWTGYNEAMIMYILALGSPTFPISSSYWFTWTSGYNWSTQYGQTYLVFPPLFGHQYSHCFIDYRQIQDIYMRTQGSTYFENSRRATLAAQAYCIDNPGNFVGYSDSLWGLTASDDPFGYVAHGAPPAQSDNGTITPTAAASSIPFAPEIVIPTLHNMYDTYGAQLWSTYGFKDAFNLTLNWWATDYIGIDQGPIIIMIENYLNGRVWNRFMQNQEIQDGLAAATFLAATPVGGETQATGPSLLFQNSPNPFQGNSVISYNLTQAGHVSLQLFDVRGRQVQLLVDQIQNAGNYDVLLEGRKLPSGVYFYQLNANGQQVGRRCVLTK